ncbi:hypothetical protein ACIQCG_38770 [Streptomyces noursei]|uniref:hypothetical protein n=1 Tax=Streptomyces noursei TaxID=1971 RepID=UPI00382B9994
MAHLQFDAAEQADLRTTAREEFPTNPALADVLESLASEGIDLDSCRDWEGRRLEVGLPERGSEHDVA